MKKSQLWRWGLVFIVIAILVLFISRPLPEKFSNLVLGSPSNDLFDEINIHTTVTTNILQGKHPLYSDRLDYPINRNLLITHKSFLHILFVAPLIALLPWPQWWNISILLAITLSTWVACYTLVNSSKNWLIGILLGLTFMEWQWYRDLISWGHLVQLWSAPLYLAIYFMMRSLNERDNIRYCWGLGICTLITSLTYWIWGAGLALLGALALTYYWPKLEKISRRNVIITVVAVATISLPTALYVLNLNPNLVGMMQQGGGLDTNIKEQAIKRAQDNALIRSDGTIKQILPYGESIAPLVIALPIALWSLSYYRRNDALFWLSAATIFFVIGWGPNLQWTHTYFVDELGHPIRLPYYYAMEWTGLGYRWQTLNTITPLFMMCTAMASALSLALCWRKFTVKYATISLISISILLFFTLQGALGAGTGNIKRDAKDEMISPTLDGTYFPMFSFKVPTFIDAESKLREGIFLEFPLSHVCNVWQLQHLHRQRTCHGRYPLASIVEKNDFVLWMHRLSRYACRDLNPQPMPDAQSGELLYGTKKVPEHLKNKTNRYPSLSRVIERSKVCKDYSIMRNDLRVTYAILHHSNCFWYAPQYGDLAYERLKDMLYSICGVPVYSDDDVSIYAWPSVSQMQEFFNSQPWEQTLAIPSEDICLEKQNHGPIPE